MASRRLERLNEQLKREIAGLLRTAVRDPRVGGVTVTGVETAPDLTTARVFVRLGGADSERAACLAGLAAAAPFLRGTMGRSLHVRRIPELHFLEDHSQERAQRIEEILSEVVIPDADDDGGSQPAGPRGGES